MSRYLRRLLSQEPSASIFEYGLIAAVIAMILLTAATTPSSRFPSPRFTDHTGHR